MHSLIGPSKAHRWLNCSGSVTAESVLPDTTSDAAEEGTAAHWVAEQVLNSYKAQGSIKSFNAGELAPNGIEITDEMLESVDLYVTDILQTVQKFGGLQKLHIEDDIKITRIHPDCFGQCDAWAFDDATGNLHVWDFKFGRRVVDVNGNAQLDCYSIGIVDSLGVDDRNIRVVQTIVQPRAFHPLGAIRRDECNASLLRAIGNDLAHAAAVAMKGSAERSSGDWCHHCKAVATCPAAIEASYNAIDTVEYIEDEHTLSAQEMAIIIRNLRMGKKRLDDVLSHLEDIALEKTKQGEVIPGYGIGNGRGGKKWKVADAEVITMGECLGVDFRKEGAKTPTQALKLVDETMLSGLFETVSGKQKLIEQSDSLAHMVFKSKEGK